MLSFILRYDVLFCNIVPHEGVHLPRNYHVTVLKSLREALRSSRLAGKWQTPRRGPDLIPM